jgi:protein O-GlcNAc transferase
MNRVAVAVEQPPAKEALSPDEVVRRSFELAVRSHDAGALSEAARLYRAILDYRPAHADSLHGLGVLAHQSGRDDLAVQLIEQALAWRAEPTFHNNHALVLLALGRPNEALAAVCRALELRFAYPEAHNALGNIQQKLGLRQEAIESYRKAVDLRADYAVAQANLAKVLLESAEPEAAREACEKALALDPCCAEAHNTLGNILRARGAFEQADAQFDRAIELQPDYAAAFNNKAALLLAMKRPEEAIAAIGRAIVLQPDLAAAHATCGSILVATGQLDAAVPRFMEAVALDPNFVEGYNNLGGALLQLDRTDEAVAAYEKAIALVGDEARAASHFNLANELLSRFSAEKAIASFGKALAANPNFAAAQNNLGVALQNLGKRDEALEAYDRVVEIDPHYAAAHSNKLMAMQYSERYGNAEALATARAFGAIFNRPDPRPFRSRDLSPGRKLRIGYVSGDFNAHPVAFFSIGAIEAHDPAQFETFCYYNCTKHDEWTARFRAAGRWREIFGKTDAETADMIRADEIDILIDLAGHTNKTRLPLFGLRPAPVQVHWVGHTGTTGLPSMDYLILDPVSAPPDADGFYTEALARLPFGRFCYTPLAADVPLAEPPCFSRGCTTFGSFNNVTKLAPEVVRLWARVATAVPGSRLLLKSRSLSEASVRENLTSAFAAGGLAPERIELRGASPYGAMLGEYNDIDIALDPFPFGGATTSCDALWMGVPVITLPGDRLASRQTLSFLHSMGRGYEAFVAGTPDDYVAKAAALAADPNRLRALRRSLREALAAAPFSDGARFAAGLERAYRLMWRRHAAGERPAPINLFIA